MTPLRLAMLVVLLAGPAAAAPREISADYRITSWGTESGLPSDVVTSVVQDHHGFLWVASPSGVVRFDGVRFTPWSALALPPLPRTAVDELFVSSDGALWIGFGGAGGIAVLEGTSLRVFDHDEGLPARPVSSLAQTVDGTMWAGTEAGLYQLSGRRWDRIGITDEAPDCTITALHANRRGDLLAATPFGVFQLKRGDARFGLVAQSPNILAFSESPSGAVWATDPVLAFRSMDDPQPHAPSWQRASGASIIHSRDGSLWVGTLGQGLWHLARRPDGTYGPPEKATTRTGLKTDGISCTFEDRDGNLWLCGVGLTRLVPYRVTAFTDIGLVRSLELASADGIWVGTTDEVLRTSIAEDVEPFETIEKTPLTLGAMRADEHGALWVASPGEIVRLTRHGSSAIDATIKTGLHQVSAITPDGHGGLVVFDESAGLFWWNGERITELHLADEVVAAGVSALFTDRSAHIWIAAGRGVVAEMTCRADCRLEDVTRDLPGGTYRSFYQDAVGVLWMGGSEGLTRHRHGHFDTIDMHSAPRLASVLAIVDDDFGYLWVGTRLGIIRFKKSEFDLLLQDPARELRHGYFDRADGVGGGVGPNVGPVSLSDNRRAVRSSDGRLWFVTGRGVTIIDPRLASRDQPKSDVTISSVQVDDRSVPPSGPLAFPKSSRLAINFGVLDLSSAAHRYRYRLEGPAGDDADWADAVSNQVVYTSLPAGAYRFAVESDTDEGTWSQAGAGLAFNVRPLFYETYWFALAVSITIGMGIWAMWNLHLVRTRHQFRLVLAERARISREIHDTLLQRLIGVMLQHDALAQEFIDNGPLSGRLRRMRQELQGYVREARDAIVDLRSPSRTNEDFVPALHRVGHESIAGRAIAFSVRVEGQPYRCRPSVEAEALRIVQEAVTNAVRHADPHVIEVLVRYEPRQLTLRVTDDGRGFDPAHAPNQGGDHYGLTVMRERAQALAAVLTIDSPSGGGTTIGLVIPTSPPNRKAEDA